jgi:nitronate monooxygenase
VLCVQGNEAGGHTGSRNLLPFLIHVLDRFPGTPTIAAGGISSGRALAAVLAAGADGAWIGTALLAATEAVYQPELAKAIVASDGLDTIHSKALDVVFGAWGPPRPPWPADVAIRSRRNAVTDRWHGHEDELAADRAAIEAYLEPLGHMDPDVFPMLYGEGAGAVTHIAPAAEIISSLVGEAHDRLQRSTATTA